MYIGISDGWTGSLSDGLRHSSDSGLLRQCLFKSVKADGDTLLFRGQSSDFGYEDFKKDFSMW